MLVVDDRRDLRFLANRILTKAGANVSEAEDGEAALALVEESLRSGNKTARFDLILLDMQMPRLDGYATAARLRKLGFEAPIIALTADAMQGDMTKCLDSGCDAYLSKPIDSRSLIGTVAHYVDDVSREQLQANRRLPAAERSAVTQSGLGSRQQRVLIVDDAVDVCVVTQQLLKMEGFETDAAHDGETAVTVAEEFVPDAVLLDLTLAGDGRFRDVASPAAAVSFATGAFHRPDGT